MSPRAVAHDEVRRLLALVPYVIAHPWCEKSELAERFGISEEQVDDDLALMMMIGVPPYSPADFLEVEEDDDGRVRLRLADWFVRPLRLSAAEGLALLAAGRALLAVPGSEASGPLASALGKLEAVLGSPGPAVDVGEPDFLAAVRAAAAAHGRIEIDYWSAGRDELTTRRIDPHSVFFALGAWYVEAFCHRAGAERMFRVDRIRAVTPTGEHFEPPSEAATPEVYRPRPDDPRVRLRLGPGAAWVAERFPTEELHEMPDGRLEIVLAVSEPTWLARLLVRLGPDADVLEPERMQDLAGATARRVLTRYTNPSGP